MVSAGGRVLPDTSAEADFLDEATNNCQSVPYFFCWNGTPGFYQIRKGFKKLTQRPGPKHSIDASAWKSSPQNMFWRAEAGDAIDLPGHCFQMPTMEGFFCPISATIMPAAQICVRQFVSKTCRSQVSLCCHSGDSVVNRSDPVATVDGCAYERDYIERLGLCHVQWSTWRFNRVWYVLMFHRCLLLGIAGGSEKGDKPIRPSLLQPQALGKKCSPSRVAVCFFGLLFTYRIKPPCNLWFRSLLYNTGRIPYNIVIQLHIITYNIVTYNSIINLSFKYFEGAYADPP